MARPRRAQNREQELKAVVEDHRGRLSSVIRGRLRDSAEADDVLQDVFEEFVEAYDLGAAINSMSAWLVTVAQNKILDRFRRRKTQEDYREAVLSAPEAEEASASGPDEEWTRQWLRTEIVNALQLLPKEQRDVFVQHELEGKSFEEISAETKVSVNTLLSRKRYATLQLREHLKEIYDELE